MKILVVDDLMVVRKMIRASAESLGAEVYEANNGIEALSVLRKTSGRIDLIFLDWNMPEMNGLEFLKKIKASQEYKGIPVIMTTSFNEREKIITAIKAGAIHYMVKPFSQEDIIKKIFRHVDISIALTNLIFTETRGLLESTTGQEVNETIFTTLPGDYQFDYWGQILVLGEEKRALVVVNMGKETAQGFYRYKVQDKDGSFEDNIVLESLTKFLYSLSKQLISNSKSLLNSIPHLFSSFVTHKFNMAAEKVLSVSIRKYSLQGVEIMVSVYIF